jgi:hypothetical protein
MASMSEEALDVERTCFRGREQRRRHAPVRPAAREGGLCGGRARGRGGGGGARTEAERR